MTVLLMFFLFLGSPAPLSLDQERAELNPERRAKSAIDFAATAERNAEAAFSSGDTLLITIPGFQPFQRAPVEAGRARAETLNAQLTIQTETEHIRASDTNTGLSVDATQNVSQIVLRENDTFHGDPDDSARSALTASNEYLADPAVPDYKQEKVSGNFGGPHSKRASFFVGADWHGYPAPLLAQQRPSAGVRILGTQYSSRLAALISRIEKSTGRKIIFKAKVGEQNDNSIIRDGDTFVINLGPGSVEDDVAHELMHAQLESEGYPYLFCLAAVPVAKVIETFISSDFDHLVINQRLLKEGYNPLLGFMSGMKDQYKSVMTVRLPPNSTPEQRVAFDVLILHELMKHVYYVRSAAAETAILGSHPEIRPRWSPLKSAIEEYTGNPDFRHAWKFAETYLALMDGITTANAPTPGFSEMFGLGPLPVSFRQKTAAASALLRVSRTPNDPHSIVRVFHGNVMVGAVTKAGEPEEDLKQPLSVFAARYGIALYPR